MRRYRRRWILLLILLTILSLITVFRLFILSSYTVVHYINIGSATFMIATLPSPVCSPEVKCAPQYTFPGRTWLSVWKIRQEPYSANGIYTTADKLFVIEITALTP